MVFDSSGRSLEQMEQNYTEPNLKQFFLVSQTAGYPLTHKSYRIGARPAVCGRYAILVGQLFSKGGSVANALQQREDIVSSDTLANDRRIIEGGGAVKWTDRLAQELHKPRRVRFQRRRIHVKGIDVI